MMDISAHNTLLALSLALYNIVDLDLKERSDIRRLVQRLVLHPDTWGSIEQDLREIISSNSSLNQLYQDTEAQLNAINGQIPQELLPTETELQELPGDSNIEVFGYFPKGKSNFDRKEDITNFLIDAVLDTNDQPKSAKQTKFLERVQRFFLHRP
jgi:hypothetical protein